jgi:hypothetical protein
MELLGAWLLSAGGARSQQGVGNLIAWGSQIK